MDLDEYPLLDGTEMAKLVRKGEVTPSELAQCAREACDQVNPQINAVIELYDDRIEGLASDAVTDGPFAGVPFLRKDLGASEAGRKQENGSRLFRGYVADHDGHYYERARRAGWNVIGRTTTPEMGLSGQTETLLHGITRNPWNLDRSAGGSSGGSSAAVAAGVVAMAHASDGGGSIRIPAGWCGLVGLNPSRGRITSGPDYQDALFGLAREFVVCRTVRDMAGALDALAGGAPGDPFFIVKAERPYVDEYASPTRRLTVAFLADSWSGYPVHPEVAAATRNVAALLGEMGHDVVEASPELEFHDVTKVVTTMFGLGAVDILRYGAALGREVDESTVEPVTLKYIEWGRALTAEGIIDAFERARRLRLTVGRFMADYDVLITPTLADTAVEHGRYATTNPDLTLEQYFKGEESLYQFMGLFNVTGQPSVTLPLAQSDANMPIGIQVVANFGDEATLVRIARDLEEAMPWTDRIPPVHVSR